MKKDRIVSERKVWRDFYVLQNRILFLKLEKLRLPKQTSFHTLALLLQPSINSFEVHCFLFRTKITTLFVGYSILIGAFYCCGTQTIDF